MRWHRLQDLVPARLRSLLRSVSARSLARLRSERQAHEDYASYSVSIHPECPPGFRFEVTNRQIDVPDRLEIFTLDRRADSIQPPPDPEVGMTTEEATMPRRLLLLIQELHGRDYERLTAAPGLSSSGCYWRCCVTPVSNIRRSHGALMWDFCDVRARYSTGQRARCFGWEDAAHDSPGQLAAKFLDRFAELSESGRGSDQAYARWYSEMLMATEPDGLIFAYADWELPGDRLPTLDVSQETWIPLPPPGEGGVEAAPP